MGQGEAHVVAVQRVGHDELGHHRAIGALYFHPERQVVTVVVAVVFKTTVVGDQAAGARAVSPGVPTQRPFTRELFDGLHAQTHVLALGSLIDVLVVDPAPAVAGDLVAQILERSGQVGVALQRHANSKYRERQAAFFELTQDAPYAHPRTVFVDTVHADVAIRETGRVEHF